MTLQYSVTLYNVVNYNVTYYDDTMLYFGAETSRRDRVSALRPFCHLGAESKVLHRFCRLPCMSYAQSPY